jgi:hypothetical protein
MTQSLDDDEKPLDPAQAAIVRRMRRLTLLSGLIMVGGFLVVFGVIAYRMSTGTVSDAPAEASVALPLGARVLSTAASDSVIAVTIETNGTTEVHLFDLATLKLRGRLTFNARP